MLPTARRDALRPIAAAPRWLAVETHENWLEANRYLNMNDLKKAELRRAGQPARQAACADLTHTA
jgi:hypothetical protein